MTVPVFADRVKETTVSTGTGSVSLQGAPDGFQAFVAAIGDGSDCYYCITNPTPMIDEWEVGQGSVSAGSPDSLSRDSVLASSNGGLPVSFSAGTKEVFQVAPAAFISSCLTNSPLTTAQNTIQPLDDVTLLTLRGSDGQTANLQEWRQSDDNLLLAVGRLGTSGNKTQVLMAHEDGYTSYLSFINVGAGECFRIYENSHISSATIIATSGFATNFFEMRLENHKITRDGNNGIFFGNSGNSCITVKSDNATAHSHMLQVDCAVDSSKGLVINGTMSQSGLLTEWNSFGAMVAWVDSAGELNASRILASVDSDVANPAFTFTNDTDTGVFRSAANVVGIAAGGVEVALFQTEGRIIAPLDPFYLKPSLDHGSQSSSVTFDCLESTSQCVILLFPARELSRSQV